MRFSPLQEVLSRDQEERPSVPIGFQVQNDELTSLSIQGRMECRLIYGFAINTKLPRERSWLRGYPTPQARKSHFDKERPKVVMGLGKWHFTNAQGRDLGVAP